MVCPAVAVVGCITKASLLGAPAFTVNELLIPVGCGGVPGAVAVIVKLPVFVIVTLKELSTPLVNAGVAGVPEKVSVPVEVRFTLFGFPLKLVTVLPLTSLAVMVMGKAVPAVCGLLIGSKMK